jgi:hypothetical protein
MPPLTAGPKTSQPTFLLLGSDCELVAMAIFDDLPQELCDFVIDHSLIVGGVQHVFNMRLVNSKPS